MLLEAQKNQPVCANVEKSEKTLRKLQAIAANKESELKFGMQTATAIAARLVSNKVRAGFGTFWKFRN